MNNSFRRCLGFIWGLIIGFVVFRLLYVEYERWLQGTLELRTWYISLPCFGLPILQAVLLADEADSLIGIFLSILLPIITGIFLLTLICLIIIAISIFSGILSDPFSAATTIVICIGLLLPSGYVTVIVLDK